MKDVLPHEDVGRLVVLLAMNCVKDHYRDFFLKIRHADRFQQFCQKLAMQATDAYFDNDAHGWFYPWKEIGKRFLDSYYREAHLDDRDIIKFCLKTVIMERLRAVL